MEEIRISQELIQKAREAKSAKELQEMAAKQDISLTMEEAEKGYAKLHLAAEELSDDELDNVSGGGCSSEPKVCVRCGSSDIYYVPSCAAYYCHKCKGYTWTK